jgi:hypothetical protein
MSCCNNCSPLFPILIQLQNLQKSINTLTLETQQQGVELTKIGCKLDKVIHLLKEERKHQEECCNRILEAIERCCSPCGETDYDHWRANYEYKAGDVVRKGNELYEAKRTHRSSGKNAPPDPEFWREYE